uniref:Coatomer subunit zeta n=1 Tax=Ostreococcus sp. 'lucimarinus' TaxID=242159 RepID=A0A7R9T0D4_9CHLO|mmetsp:Transcript_2610/g.10115  ORF Transcript_2610/g.10115 Transcript_2610/m.10115 type:complete len:177 (+) Transcript_2610:280-810(+)
MRPASLPSITSLVILDNEGKRIAAKYYSPEWKNPQKQVAFEQAVFNKTNAATQELDVIVLEHNLVVYRNAIDFQVYAVAPKFENEVILAAVLQALHGALTTLTSGVMEKHVLLEHFDECMLTFDELIDDGFILETDPDIICNRVSMQDSVVNLGSIDHPLSQALANAKEISRNLLR